MSTEHKPRHGSGKTAFNFGQRCTALIIGRVALAALQRLESAGDTTQGNGGHGASQQCGNSSQQPKPEGDLV